MNKYKFTVSLEVRSSVDLQKTPEYIIKGHINANIPDVYKRIKNHQGEIVDIKQSIFTDNAVESMRVQAKSKKIYVDTEHKTAVSFNVNHILDKAEVSQEIKDSINSQLEISDLPLIKLKNLYKDEMGKLVVDARLNPHYRTIDDKHKSYFDAVWGSLQDKFIDGVSFTFAATDVKTVNGMDIINDVNLFGIDLTGGAAIPENQIFEVAMRAVQDVKQVGDEKMNEKMNELEAREKQLQQKEEEVKKKEENLTKTEEEKTKEDINQEKEQHKKEMEDMKTEIKEMKEGKETTRKGVVPREDKYAPEEQITGDEKTLEAKQKLLDVLEQNVQIKNRYPNHEDMFNAAPRKVNPDGEITLGMLLHLQRQDPKYIEEVLGNMDPLSRNALLGSSNGICHFIFFQKPLN